MEQLSIKKLWSNRRQLALMLGVVFVLHTNSGFAKNPVVTEDTNSEIPQITWLLPDGQKPGPEEIQRGKQFRDVLHENLNHYRGLGLPSTKPKSLETILLIPSYEGVSLRRAVAAHASGDPTVPDLDKHIKEQWDYFARTAFYKMLQKKETDGGYPKGMLTNRFFDNYANARYGYSVPNFRSNWDKNPLLSSISGDREQIMPADNAYFGRFPKIDLTKDLPLTEQDMANDLRRTAIFLEFLSETPDPEKFAKLAEVEKEPDLSRKMVILPRTTQTRNDKEIGTDKDNTVTWHEQGHWFDHVIREIPRLSTEYSADAQAYSRTGSPLIGPKFTSDSGIAAKRLRASGGDPNLIDYFEQLARMPALRDMSLFYDMDTIGRKHIPGNDYSAGNPLRYFYHRLFTDPEIKPNLQEALQRVHLKMVDDLGSVPKITSDVTETILGLQGFLQEIRTMKEVAKKYQSLKQALEKKGVTSLSDDDELKLQAAATRSAMETLARRELKSIKERLNNRDQGKNAVRTPQGADYLVPEMLRSYYRTAKAMNEPVIAEKMKLYAGTAMGALPLTIKTGPGPADEDIFFLLKPVSAKSAVAKTQMADQFQQFRTLQKTLREAEAKNRLANPDGSVSPELEAARATYNSGVQKISDQVKDLAYLPKLELLAKYQAGARQVFADLDKKQNLDPEVRERVRKEVTDDFEDSLDRVQEFERTGLEGRLSVARPHLTLYRTVQKIQEQCQIALLQDGEPDGGPQIVGLSNRSGRKGSPKPFRGRFQLPDLSKL